MSDLIERLGADCSSISGRQCNAQRTEAAAELSRLTAEVERLTASNERIQTLHEGLMKDAEKRYEQMYAEALAASKEVERLRANDARYQAALLAAKRSHYECDDCWFSCPRSGECCNEAEGSECNCGADRHNAALDAAIKEAGNG